MATLPALTVGNRDDTQVGISTWSLGSSGDLGDNSDATYGGNNNNSTGEWAAGWELGNMPTDFGTMSTLSLEVRYGWGAAPSNLTWGNISASIWTADGTTLLAAFTSGASTASTALWQPIVQNITTTGQTNSGAVAFSYVNTTADKTAWDSAVVHISVQQSRSKGGQVNSQRVYEADITGTYATGASTIPGTFTADANIKKLDIAGTFTADAYVKQTVSGSFTANAYVATTASGSFTADAYISTSVSSNFTADANISVTDILGNFSADANISRLDIPGSFTSDAYVKRTFGLGGANIVRESFSSGSGTGGVADTNHVVTKPTGTQAGDVLVLTLATNGGSLDTDPFPAGLPEGWVLAAQAIGQSNPKVNALYKVCGASEPASYTFVTTTAVYDGYVCSRYSGVDNVTPMDVAAVGTDGVAATTFSLTGLTTATDGAMLVVGVSANSSSAARLSINGGEPVTEFEEVFQSSAIKDTMAADGVFATAGATGTIDGAIDQSLAWAGVVVALRPAATGGELTFTADAFITAQISGSFTADAFVQSTVAGAFSADAYVQQTLAGTFSADANISQTVGGTFTADAYISGGAQGSFTADAHISATVPGSFTADAYIQQTFAGSFSADADILVVQSGSFSADAYILRTFPGTLTADAYVRQTFSGSATADAYIQQTVAGSVTADANISATVAGSFTADAWVQVTGTIPGTFTADANIAATPTGTFTADAYIRSTASGTFTADSYILRVTSDTFSADAYVLNVLTGSWTADAFIKKTIAGTLTADAHITLTTASTFTADAHISGTVAGSFTADAWIANLGVVLGDFTADAYIKNTVAGAFTADANIRQTYSGSFTADSHIGKTFAGSVTADGYIQNTIAGSVSADAYIKQTFSGSLSADAYILTTLSGAFTADGHVSATVSGSFLATAWVSNPSAVLRVTSSPTKNALLRSGTTKAVLVATETYTSTALTGRTTKDG